MLKVNLQSNQAGGAEDFQPVQVTIPLSGDPIENLARETLKMLRIATEAEINGYNRIYGGDIVSHFIKELNDAKVTLDRAKFARQKTISLTVYVSKQIVENIKRYLANPNAPSIKPVSQMTAGERITEVINRCLPLLPEGVAEQLKALLTPAAIATMVVVLGVWVAGHFFGISEIADAILLIVGGIFLGMAAFQAGQELYEFAVKTLNGTTEKDLNEAAQHLANAISLVGVQVVLALFVKNAGRAKIFRQPYQNATPLTLKTVPTLPRTQGKIFYRSKASPDYSMPEGFGATNPLTGNMRYSPNGSPKSIALAKIHEKVHSILTPKLQFLREIRVVPRYNSYIKSSLFRYLEEALAETVAQVSVNGLRSVITGIKFPVKNGYVTLAEMGAEASGLFLGSVGTGGLIYLVYFNSTAAEKNGWMEFKVNSQ